jgi:hypothetical protein
VTREQTAFALFVLLIGIFGVAGAVVTMEPGWIVAAPYEYSRVDEKNYRLCAVFARERAVELVGARDPDIARAGVPIGSASDRFAEFTAHDLPVRSTRLPAAVVRIGSALEAFRWRALFRIRRSLLGADRRSRGPRNQNLASGRQPKVETACAKTNGLFAYWIVARFANAAVALVRREG